MAVARTGIQEFTYPLVPLGFAVVLGVMQWLTGWTAYPFVTQTATVHWATFLAVFRIGACLFADEPDSPLVLLRYALVQFHGGGGGNAPDASLRGGKVFWLFPSGATDYVMGPILYRNHYAAFIEAVLPIALYQALHSEKDSLLYSVMAACYVRIGHRICISSRRRSGVRAEILAVIVLMWFRGRTSGRAIGLVHSSRLAILLVSLHRRGAGWQSVWNRFWEPDQIGVRRELAISSLRMIASHPWSGVGLGAWPTVYPHYAIVDTGAFANQAHNDWLQWTAEGGLPFGILMAGLFSWSLRPGIPHCLGPGRRLAVFLHAFVDYPFSRPALGSWTMVILAMLASAYRARGATP